MRGPQYVDPYVEIRVCVYVYVFFLSVKLQI